MREQYLSHACKVVTSLSKHVKVGHYRPASEKPFTLHFAGGQIVIQDGMLAGLHKLVQLSCGLRT